ncbi:hypothetical protein CC85DRAFT_326956 [Cutaneotrichosporon oleaginosum]|uniref:Uncharacterized protein n=1 Tax=Cutaneotrichosporon oleaginosum TaxID=879819 RepID=A0A0J0XRV3_9TREE|nr:uncharacterized protein CC85DRAFT_326956 [Cutaneotrichosporon oleaginosum]KLT43810.1 hypothetical protein CC85DRAFT_326956 [Cutaneotrichosporon oleaginosum]TXT06449.1 hypothetical protein COLE_05780 [Cutaneotrichosporon oleaginosum]
MKLALLSLASLASAVVIPEYTRQWCEGEGTSDYSPVILEREINEFCTIAVRDFKQDMDLGNGYYLRIQDSQGGSYEPCFDALTWVLEECAQHGKLGEWRQNANYYRFGRYNVAE